METKLNKKEIIQAEDLLAKELEDVCGGAATEEASACITGCIEGAKKKKNDTDDSEEP